MVNEHFERKRNAADAREMCSPTRKAHSLSYRAFK